MAVNSFASTLYGKLKKFGSKQKDSIRENLCTKGEFPWIFQIFGAVIFWFLIFLIFVALVNPAQRWIIVVVAVIGAFGFVEGLNFIGRRIVLRDFKEEEFPEVDSFDLSENSILIGSSYHQGGIVLSRSSRGRYYLTPVVALKINSISSSTSSIFNSISNVTLQKLSLKYHCSIIDTAKYEILLLKGETKSSKPGSLFITLQILEESFFQEAFNILSEFGSEKKVDFEKPEGTILKEIFPLYDNILHISQDDEEIHSNSDSTDLIEDKTDDQYDQDDEFIDYLVKENLVDSEPSEAEDTLDTDTEHDIVDESQITNQEEEEKTPASNQKEMIRNILLGELNFSIESFLSAARGYYKKAIEAAVENKYDVNTERFLKTVHLFCEKENIPFYYPSYTYLLKIVEFLDIELPSSTEIENFVERLSDDYTSVSIDKKNKQKLTSFLDSKFKQKQDSSSEEVIDTPDSADITTIPQPPAKNKKQLLIDGGD
jgi:hypothetical protein